MKKKICHFFHLWAYFLTKYFVSNYSCFCERLKISQNDFFRKSIFCAEDIGRSIQRWEWISLTSNDIPNRWYVHIPHITLRWVNVRNSVIKRWEISFHPLRSSPNADIHPPRGYMWNMDILAIWDVI